MSDKRYPNTKFHEHVQGSDMLAEFRCALCGSTWIAASVQPCSACVIHFADGDDPDYHLTDLEERRKEISANLRKEAKHIIAGMDRRGASMMPEKKIGMGQPGRSISEYLESVAREIENGK